MVAEDWSIYTVLSSTFCIVIAPKVTASGVDMIAATVAAPIVVYKILSHVLYILRSWYGGSLGHCVDLSRSGIEELAKIAL